MKLSLKQKYYGIKDAYGLRMRDIAQAAADKLGKERIGTTLVSLRVNNDPYAINSKSGKAIATVIEELFEKLLLEEGVV